jgi:hypothetical protein
MTGREGMRAMSNSALVSYTKISPNKSSPRNHAIDTISIHCVAGNSSVETLGGIFAPTTRQASSNYGVGSDGRVGMYCEEKDRSWCTSSPANDHRAITIEVANDGGAPDWHVSDAALASLINLLADICRRNNIKQLLWKADKNLIGQVDKQNMTVHRWFASKSCPGDYLFSKHGYIADEVNKLLGGAAPQTAAAPAPAALPPQADPAFTPYAASIKASTLNVRKGPGTNYAVAATLANDENTYTIVEEAPGAGASMWCKLKSGIGWVSIDFILKK